MAKRGRPSKFTKELAARICQRLAAGETLLAICRDPDMPSDATVRGWALSDSHGFFAEYARAREIGYLRMADEIGEIADDKAGDANRDRLRVDTRKWLLAKCLPKVFGDRVSLAGADGTSPVHVITEIRRTIVDPREAE